MRLILRSYGRDNLFTSGEQVVDTQIARRPGMASARRPRRVRAYGLIEQQQPRSWQIADPLLSAAIHRLRQGANYVELHPDRTALSNPAPGWLSAAPG